MDDVNHEHQTKPAHDDPPEAVTPLLLGQVEVFLYAVSKHRLIASTTSRLDATVAREETLASGKAYPSQLDVGRI